MILAEWAAVAIFNVRLYAQSEEERGALERAVHALEATTEIARAVGGETDPGRVMETIAKRTRALIGARSLLILLHDGRPLEVVTMAGECGSDAVGRYVSIDAPTPEAVLPAIRTVGIEARAALVAPLEFHGRPLGMIVALDRIEEGPDFYADDERLLAGASASAATAVATVQSVTEERLRHSLRTAERERGRWARELHDSILQGLGTRRVLLSSALKRGEGPELVEVVRSTIEEVDRDIEELRALITELRPATLDQLGLIVALEDLAERISSTSEVELSTDLSLSEGRVDSELETVVYRLAQEALNNAVKHAEARVVTLQVAERSGRLDVLISDDGKGFDPTEKHDGFGVVGMRERIELVDGELEIESRPGAGTRVMASVPLAKDATPPVEPGGGAELPAAGAN